MGMTKGRRKRYKTYLKHARECVSAGCEPAYEHVTSVVVQRWQAIKALADRYTSEREQKERS